MPLRLFIIRHGETAWSLSGQHSGRADIALTANGKAEAKLVGKRIRNIAFSAVLVSPLSRAVQTCVNAGLSTPAKIEADLTEWDNGDYEGLTHRQIEESNPTWNLFRNGCPNGESPREISDRVDRLILKLKKLDGNIAIFTHSHLGRVLGTRWIGLQVDYAQRFLLDTGAISVLTHDRDDQPAIVLWNSTNLSQFESSPRLLHRAQDESTRRRQAIERWENEGGEVVAANKET